MLDQKTKVKPINQLLYSISIRNRLFLYFIILIFLPTTIISVTIYNKSTAIITNKTDISIKNNLNTIASNIHTKFDSIDNISTLLYLNQELIDILSSQRPTDKIQITNEIASLDRILDGYNFSGNNKASILPRLYMYNRPEYLQYSFSDKVTDISVIEKEEWYKSLPSKSNYTLTGFDSDLDSIKIAKRLFGLKASDIPFSGVLTLDVSVDYFNDLLVNFKPTPNSTSFIMDTKGIINVSPTTSLLGENIAQQGYIFRIIRNNVSTQGSFIETINHENMLVSYHKMNDLGWIIVTLSPMKELNGELNSLNQVIVMVIIICMLAGLFAAYMLSENVAYPIQKLVQSMSTTVHYDNFDFRFEYKRDDEFSFLISTYKKMLGEIKELIDKLYISEINKKEAELKALQAQINPHFLYNTLDSVNWLAIKHKVPDISTMVISLSDFFRYSLSKGKNIISFEEEKKQIESYLTIQKIRFKDKLDYCIHLEEELYTYLTVKLILQPLVENAIVHGIEKKRGGGTIYIYGIKVKDIIEIKIIDDGVGADPAELNAILKDQHNQSKSYGIKNVNERIHHFFGHDYGIKYYENKVSGITAVITVPAIQSMEGFNVKNDHSR